MPMPGRVLRQPAGFCYRRRAGAERIPVRDRHDHGLYGVNAEDSGATSASPTPCSTAPRDACRSPTCGAPTSCYDRCEPMGVQGIARHRAAHRRSTERHRRARRPGPRRRPPPHARPPGQFEHVRSEAGTDAWFLLGMLNVLIAEGLVDHEFLARDTTGFDELAALVDPVHPRVRPRRAPVSGRDRSATIARTFGVATAAVVYGRTGTCTQRFGTLNNVLLRTSSTSSPAISEAGGLDVRRVADRHRQDVARSERAPRSASPHPRSGLPDVVRVPAVHGAATGHHRARRRARSGRCVMIGGNPVLSAAPAGHRWRGPGDAGHCSSRVDLYVNETNKYARLHAAVRRRCTSERTCRSRPSRCMRPAI